MEIAEKMMQEENFSYDGYQVVRGEFFAHTFEPSITFNDSKVYVNTACLNRMPTVEYIQILINQQTKKLVVRPCREDEKDSFRWCSNTTKRRPKQITCRIFYAKLAEMMQWNPNYRYKLLGKMISANGEQLYIFDLKATEVYQRFREEGGKGKNGRTPIFPSEWQNQFGLPVEEHRKQLQINIFDGYTVFGIKDMYNCGKGIKSDEK
ncbi:integrase [bacterium 1XD8-76]|nr:integrase [bacterium 1XD8-76]